MFQMTENLHQHTVDPDPGQSVNRTDPLTFTSAKKFYFNANRKQNYNNPTPNNNAKNRKRNKMEWKRRKVLNSFICRSWYMSVFTDFFSSRSCCFTRALNISSTLSFFFCGSYDFPIRRDLNKKEDCLNVVLYLVAGLQYSLPVPAVESALLLT